MKPRLLDLFCGAGGAAMGYHLAGFEVIGVDIEPQPHYPFEFHQIDAFEFLELHRSTFDAFHASPPCQEYSRTAGIRNFTAAKYNKEVNYAPKLVPQIQAALMRTGVPWVVENVPGAPLENAIILCGSMFGRPIRRHRLFASSILLFAPGQCCHGAGTYDVCGGKVRGSGIYATSKKYTQSNGYVKKRESYPGKAVGCAAFGIDWMTVKEMSQSIPPDYTKCIGEQLMRALGR